MTIDAQLEQAFRLLQAGDAAQALQLAAQLARVDPFHARVPLVAGIALRALGEPQRSRAALEQAARLAPDDYAVAFELGATCEALGEAAAALAHYERCATLRPAFAAGHFALGMQRFARGEWGPAADAFATVVALDPANVAALVNLGLALGEKGDLDAARAALDQALARAPGTAAAHHALGRLLHRQRRLPEALAQYEAAAAAQPNVGAWDADRGKALLELGRIDEAVGAFVHAVRVDATQVPVVREHGEHLVVHGHFSEAARMFAAALERAPDDAQLPLFLAQVELLLGQWREGWAYYARREHRLRFEHERAAAGEPYRVPAPGAVAGRTVAIVGEQGLGDMLFFLRFAPRLAAAGARVVFAGTPRLHPLLSRTGLFEAMHEDFAGVAPDALPLLAADLPLFDAHDAGIFPPPLRIPVDAARAARWHRTLEAAGPRPWIGVTWRAGTRREILSRGLLKTVPLERLFGALRGLPGTLIALQRGLEPGEIEAARGAAGRPVHDLSSLGDDLDDLLAVVSLLDRHVAVSNTNVHLAAAAARTADVLVPFPPEWRWGLEGASAWFPGFAVHRQARDGDWAPALAALAR